MTEKLGLPPKIDDWTKELIEKLLKSGYEESQKLEFKKFLEIPKGTNKEKKEYKNKIEELVASFANAKGGFILFGVTKEREVHGVNLRDNEEINLKLSEVLINTTPSISFESRFIELDNKKLVIIKVHECADKPVQCSNGSFHIRLGGQTIQIPRDYLRDIFMSVEVKKQRYERLKFEVGYMLNLIEENKNLGTSTDMSPFFKLRIDNLQQSISDYYGYFKAGAEKIITSLNQNFAEIKKQEKFFETAMMIQGTKRWGLQWCDLNGFLMEKSVKDEFSKINYMLYSTLKDVKPKLISLMDCV